MMRNSKDYNETPIRKFETNLPKCEEEPNFGEIQVADWMKMPVRICNNCTHNCYQYAYLENLQKHIGSLDEFWEE